MSSYIEISVKEAEAIIETQDPMILDVRDAHSYREQHIEGAMLGHEGLLKHLSGTGDFERPVVVYCYHGTSSKTVADQLGQAGYSHAYSLRGGFTAWKKRTTLYAEHPYSPKTTAWLERECFEKLALNTARDGGVTPLIAACQQGFESAALELIVAGADVNQRDGHGNGALWAACYAGNLDLIEDLIDAGSNINSQNAEGVTALMYAASAGKTEVVSMLLARGADPLLVNEDGFTAVDLASSKTALKLLRRHQLN